MLNRLIALAIDAIACEADDIDHDIYNEANACHEEPVYLDRPAWVATIHAFTFTAHRRHLGGEPDFDLIPLTDPDALFAIPHGAFTYADSITA